jgi:hypothetical protein
MSEKWQRVTIEPLDEGCIVHLIESDYTEARRLAATSRLDALTLAARALGYRGVIRFDDEPRTVEVPIHMGRAEFEAAMNKRATDAMNHVAGMYDLPEGPILTQAFGLGPGPAVDDDEPPLRAGTAIKPDDLL